MPSISASFVAAKRSFSRRFAWFRRHEFSYLQNFDRSWSSRRCFWHWFHAVWAISRSRQKPRSRHRSVSCDRVNVNKPKFRNFDWPLGLPGHLQSSFLHQQHVISSKYDGAGAWQLPLPSVAEQQSRSCKRKQTKKWKVHAIFAEFWWTIRVVWSSPAMLLTSTTCHLFEKRWRESVITVVAVSCVACCHHLHFEISRKIHNFTRSFRRLSWAAASRILLYTTTHHQMG